MREGKGPREGGRGGREEITASVCKTGTVEGRGSAEKARPPPLVTTA